MPASELKAAKLAITKSRKLIDGGQAAAQNSDGGVDGELALRWRDRQGWLDIDGLVSQSSDHVHCSSHGTVHNCSPQPVALAWWPGETVQGRNHELHGFSIAGLEFMLVSIRA